MQTPPFIISPDGNITVILDGTPHAIGVDHPNYSQILNVFENQSWDELEALVDVPRAIQEFTAGNIVVDNFGEVTYNGEPLHNTITERITDFYTKGLPFQPLVLFLENIMKNPSFNSRDQLYSFLEHKGMPITEDGCFLAYKGVTHDLKDCHTKTFDNSPGQVHEMDRHNVDDNPNNHCSSGFHVGAYNYASSFGQRLLVVKVNPKDAVSVPSDHNCEKLRVCRYEVIRVIEKTTIMQESLYTNEPCDDWCDEEDNYYEEF